MSYTDETGHVINELGQIRLILEGVEKHIKEKPKLDSFDGEDVSKILQSLNNAISNAASELKKSELRHKEMYENSPILYITVNLDGIIINCNMRYANRLGYTRNEILGTSIYDYVEDNQVERMREVFETWKKRGHVTDEEVWFKTKFGTKFPALMNISNLYDVNGEVVGSNTVIQEISDVYLAKKTSEEKIRLDARIKDLEKSDKLRQELLSVVKHEFRTPLVPIKGYCEMLLEQPYENLSQAQQTALNGIFNGIKKFENIIDNILELHALETNNIIFNKEVILVRDFMAAIANDFSKKLPKGIEFINPSHDVVEIHGDVIKLRRIFGCLLDNALSFVPKENGKIEVGAKKNNENVLFYVKNNGPDIPKQEQQNIFKKFYQVDTSARRRHQGMGIGLAICKEIVEKLDGKIWCQSEPRQETTFYFSIPINEEKIAMESLQK